MAKRGKIDGLPPDVRRWLERALTENGFSGYTELEELLREKGYAISKSAIHRYGQKIERRFAAIKASTEAARLLTEGAADDQDARSEAVIALVQTEMFEAILNLQDAGEEGMPEKERIGLLSSAAKNIATLARASVAQKKWRTGLARDIAARMDALEGEAKTGKAGFDLETLRRVREELYGITG